MVSLSSSYNKKSYKQKVAEKILKYFLYSENVSEDRVLYGAMWKNMVEANTPQLTT